MDAGILVIDDSSVVRAQVREALETKGWTVSEAFNGRSARMAMVHSLPPDLVVLDLNMPDPNGFDLLRERQLGGPGAESRVLVLSGRDTDDDRMHALRLGADHYMTKPFAVDELVAAVTHLLAATPAQVCAERSLELSRVRLRCLRQPLKSSQGSRASAHH